MKKVRFSLVLSLALLLAFSAQALAVTELVWWDKWQVDTLEGQAVLDSIAKFNAAHDDIKVRYVATSEIIDSALIAIAGGTPPDIIGMWTNQTGPFAHQNAIQPLDAFLEAIDFDWDILEPLAQDLAFFDGKIYTLPLTLNLISLQYNKVLFEEYGVAGPPATLAELDALNQKFIEVNDAGHYTRLGFSAQFPGWWNYHWAWIFGGSWFDENGQPTINSDQNIAAYEWLRAYNRSLDVDKVRRFQAGFGEYYSATNPFMSQRVAMQLMGTWDPAVLVPFNQGQVVYGASGFPVAEGVTPFVMAEGDSVFIPHGSRNPEKAIYFITWMLENIGNPANQPISPVRAWNAQAQAVGNPNSILFDDILRLELRAASPVPNWDFFVSRLGRDMEEIEFGTANIRQIFDRIQRDVERRR